MVELTDSESQQRQRKIEDWIEAALRCVTLDVLVPEEPDQSIIARWRESAEKQDFSTALLRVLDRLWPVPENHGPIYYILQAASVIRPVGLSELLSRRLEDSSYVSCEYANINLDLLALSVRCDLLIDERVAAIAQRRMERAGSFRERLQVFQAVSKSSLAYGLSLLRNLTDLLSSESERRGLARVMALLLSKGANGQIVDWLLIELDGLMEESFTETRSLRGCIFSALAKHPRAMNPMDLMLRSLVSSDFKPILPQEILRLVKAAVLDQAAALLVRRVLQAVWEGAKIYARENLDLLVPGADTDFPWVVYRVEDGRKSLLRVETACFAKVLTGEMIGHDDGAEERSVVEMSISSAEDEMASSLLSSLTWDFANRRFSELLPHWERQVEVGS